jgi:hypothetical protein
MTRQVQTNHQTSKYKAVDVALDFSGRGDIRLHFHFRLYRLKLYLLSVSIHIRA